MQNKSNKILKIILLYNID